MKSGVEEWSLLGCYTMLTAKYWHTYYILNSVTFLYLISDHWSFPLTFLACTSCGPTHSMTSVSLLSQLFLTCSIPIFSGKASPSLTAWSRRWSHMLPAMSVTVTSWHSIFTYWLTYPMEQSLPWEGSRFSASQEISHIVWILKVHYHILKCLPLVPVLIQINLTS